MRERKSGVRIAFAKMPANEQLGVGAKRGSSHVASLCRLILGLLDVIVLCLDERPNSIHLDALARRSVLS